MSTGGLTQSVLDVSLEICCDHDANDAAMNKLCNRPVIAVWSAEQQRIQTGDCSDAEVGVQRLEQEFRLDWPDSVEFLKRSHATREGLEHHLDCAKKLSEQRAERRT